MKIKYLLILILLAVFSIATYSQQIRTYTLNDAASFPEDM
jgi:hypothetical protein